MSFVQSVKLGFVATTAIIFAAGSALAQETLPHTEPLAVDTPLYDSTSMTELVGFSFNLQAGEVVQVSGKTLAKHSLTLAILQAARVECKASSGSWGSAHYVNSTRNNLGANESAVNANGLPLYARFIYTAASTGTYDCRLVARIARGNWGSTPASDRKMDFLASDTYLSIAKIGTGSVRWGTDNDTYDGGTNESYITSGSRDLMNSPTWSPNVSATSFETFGEVELTTCKNGTSSCPPAFHTTFSTASVTTTLYVEQLNASGVACNTFSSTPKTYSISNDIHHLKSYNNLTVPVNVTGTCLRNFRSFVRVTLNSGNTTKVDYGDFIGGPNYVGYSVGWFANP